MVSFDHFDDREMRDPEHYKLLTFHGNLITSYSWEIWEDVERLPPDLGLLNFQDTMFERISVTSISRYMPRFALSRADLSTGLCQAPPHRMIISAVSSHHKSYLINHSFHLIIVFSHHKSTTVQ